MSFPLKQRKLIRGADAHVGAGLGKAADYEAYYEPLYLPFSGIIKKWQGTQGGNWITLTRENGDKIKFAHLDMYWVGEGYHTEGTVVASTGNTGTTTTGPHLHLETWVNGQRTDPEQYNFNNMPKINIKVIRQEDDKYKQRADDGIHNAWEWFAKRGIDTDWNSDNPHIILTVHSKDTDGVGGRVDRPYEVPYNANLYISLLDSIEGGRSTGTPYQVIVHEISHCLWYEVGLGNMHGPDSSQEDRERYMKLLEGGGNEGANEFSISRFLEEFDPLKHFLQINNNDMKLYQDSANRVWAVQDTKKFWILDPATRDAFIKVAGEPSKVDLVYGEYAGALGWFNTDKPK